MRQARMGYGLMAMTALYFVVHHAQKFGWGSEIFRFYTKDILLIPIILSATTITFKLLKKRFYPGNKEIVAAVIYATILFELVLPHFGMSFAMDPIDILCYIMGGIGFRFAFRDFHLIKLEMPNETQRMG
jgi:hypothetical protein